MKSLYMNSDTAKGAHVDTLESIRIENNDLKKKKKTQTFRVVNSSCRNIILYCVTFVDLTSSRSARIRILLRISCNNIITNNRKPIRSVIRSEYKLNSIGYFYTVRYHNVAVVVNQSINQTNIERVSK